MIFFIAFIIISIFIGVNVGAGWGWLAFAIFMIIYGLIDASNKIIDDDD